MKVFAFLILTICGFAVARPTFKPTPVKGKVNYSTMPLKDGVITLDDDQNIQAIKCTGNNMTFTLKSKSSVLKKNAIVTGGKQWGCGGIIYKRLDAVSYKGTTLTAKTTNVPTSQIYRNFYGYEQCSKVISAVNTLHSKAKSAKAKAESQLKTLESTAKSINDSGLVNKVTAAKKNVESAFNNLDNLVKKYKSIITGKAKKSTPTCSTSEATKFAAKVTAACNVNSIQTSVTTAKKAMDKKIADAKKTFQSALNKASTELSKASKKLSELKANKGSTYDALKKRVDSLQNTFSQLKSSKLTSLPEITAAQTKVNALLKDASSLLSTATSNLSTVLKQKAEAAKKALEEKKKKLEEAKKEAEKKASKAKEAAKKKLNTTKNKTASILKNATSPIKSAVASGKKKAASIAKNATTTVKSAAATGKKKAASVAKNVTTTIKKAANTTKTKATGFVKNTTSAIKKKATNIKNQGINAIKNKTKEIKQNREEKKKEQEKAKAREETAQKTAEKKATSDTCNKSPKIKQGKDSTHVSYTTKVLNFDPNASYQIYVLDKYSDNIKYICCTEKSKMNITWNGSPDKTIVNHSGFPILYITGGPEWGCGSGAIYRKLEKVFASDSTYTTIETSVVSADTMFRDETTLESCTGLQQDISKIYKNITETQSNAKKTLASIKKAKSEIEKVGSSSEKKSAETVYKSANEEYEKLKKAADEAVSFKIKQCEELKKQDVTDITNKKTKVLNYAKEIDTYSTKMTKSQGNVTITPSNFKKIAQETYNAILKFTSSLTYTKASMTPKSFVTHDSAKKFTNTISNITQTATKEFTKKHSTNDEAKASYNTLVNLKKKGDKALEDYKNGTEKAKSAKSDAKTILKNIEDVMKDCKAQLKPYNQKTFGFLSTKKDTTPNLVKEYQSLEKEYKTAKSDINKNVTSKVNTTLPNLLKKWQTFQTKLKTELKTGTTYTSDLKTTKENVSKAKLASNSLKLQDKELAATATKKIEATEKLQKEAESKFNSGDLTTASKKIAEAKKQSEEALKAAQQKINTASYTSATTSNAQQRSELVYNDVLTALTKAKEPLKTLKEYNKDLWTTHDKKLTTINKEATSCKKDARKPKTDADATKAITCIQTAKKNVEAEQKEIEKDLKSSREKIQIKVVNNVVTIPEGKVSSVKCSGTTVTVTFKEKVYIDLKKGITVKGSSGCYDSSTKQKGPYTRVVEKVTTNEPKKIKFETKTGVVPATTTENTKGFTFVKEPSKSISKGEFITAKLYVSDESFVGKKAVFQVLSATNESPVSGYKTTVTLAKSNPISIEVTQKGAVNAALLRATVNGKTVATTKNTFSINPTIKITSPKVEGQRYLQKDNIVVQYSADAGFFKKVKCSFSFVSTVNNTAAYTVKPSSSPYQIQIKSLPKKVVTGRYKIALDCNNVVVTSVPFYINRDDNAITRLNFTSPRDGEVFSKGDTIDVKWKATNAHKDETFDLYISSEDNNLGDYVLNFFKGPIKSGVKMSAGHYSWTVDNQFPSSKYFFKARWTDGHEVTSERFTLNKENCFKFGKTDIKQKSKGKYVITANFNKTSGCYLKASDQFEVKLVTVLNNKQTKDLTKTTLTANKSTYKPSFNLGAGEAKNLRFLITTAKDKKGEISDDFSCPVTGSFEFKVPASLTLDCSRCGKSSSLNVYSALSKTRSYDVSAVSSTLCSLCATANKARETFVGKFKNITKMPDLVKTLSPPKESNQTTIAQSFQKAIEDPKKLQTMFDTISAKLKPFSMKISCSSCVFKGNYKAYNLVTFIADIKSMNLEAEIEYNLNADITFSIGYVYSQTRVGARMTGNDAHIHYLRGALSQTKYDDYFKSLGKFSGVTLPIIGNSLTAPIDGLADKFNATCQIAFKGSFTITGRVIVSVAASGKLQLNAAIENDVDRSKEIVPVKSPSFTVKLKDADVSCMVSLSLEGDLGLSVTKKFSLSFNLVIAKVTGTLTFSWKGFGETSGHGECKAGHHFEMKFTVDVLKISASASFMAANFNHSFNSVVTGKTSPICF